jgi:hypothetical protein
VILFFKKYQITVGFDLLGSKYSASHIMPLSHFLHHH